MDPRKIIKPFSGLLSLPASIRYSGENLIFPFYHAVTNEVPAHLKHLYRVKTIEEFQKDLDFLTKYFNPLSPAVLLNGSGSARISEPSFILSFDDGLREVKEVIAPLLKERGLSAIFFLNNEFINNKDLFFRYKASILVENLDLLKQGITRRAEIGALLKRKDPDIKWIIKKILSIGYANRDLLDSIAVILGVSYSEYLEKNRPYLDDQEIRTLIEEGFFIGSHSTDHPYFIELENGQQLQEITESMEGIERMFKPGYGFFAFPFTDQGFDKVLLRHEQVKYDAIFGTSGIKKQTIENYYQRIPMEKSGNVAEDVIKTEYIYFMIKRLFNR